MERERDLTKSQLFLDDMWIEDQQRLQRRWYQADIFPESVLRPEKPWEGTEIIRPSVFKYKDLFRAYYQAVSHFGSYYCVAESEDGFVWERPDVGAVEFKGNTRNNIVWKMEGRSPSAVYDPTDADAPFKLFFHGREPTSGRGGLRVATSLDGFHFETRPGVLVENVGDRKYMMFDRPGGKYVLFTKLAESFERYGGRCQGISVGASLETLSRPKLILKPDLVDDPNVEFYGFTAFQYSDRYIGLIERYRGVPDVIDVTLAWSDDLEHWERPNAREPFIGPEYPWNRMWSENNTAPPIVFGNQLWFYFGGKSGAHSHSKHLGPRQYTAIGLAMLTVDRFVSISGDFKAGKLLTRPMTWPGGDLMLNASTTRNLDGYPLEGGGLMAIEVLDQGGDPVDGFSGDERAVFDGNVPCRSDTRHSATIRWPGDRSMNELAGRRIKLAFHMRDSHLYSFRSSG